MNLSKTVSLNDSSKRCLSSSHEFSQYVLCWIAFFAFITLDYHYKFHSRLSYNIQNISQTIWPFCMKISNAFGSCGNTLSLSTNFASSKYHHLPLPFPGEQLIAIATAQIWKITTVPCGSSRGPTRFFQVNLKCQWTPPLPWEIIIIYWLCRWTV